MQFIHMPGYARSPFLAAMETSLLRMVVSTDAFEEAFTEKETASDVLPRPKPAHNDDEIDAPKVKKSEKIS